LGTTGASVALTEAGASFVLTEAGASFVLTEAGASFVLTEAGASFVLTGCDPLAADPLVVEGFEAETIIYIIIYKKAIAMTAAKIPIPIFFQLRLFGVVVSVGVVAAEAVVEIVVDESIYYYLFFFELIIYVY
jgi:hypothetical protein